MIRKFIALLKARKAAQREAYARHLFSEIALNLQREGKPSGVGAAEIRAWRALAAHVLGDCRPPSLKDSESSPFGR